MNTFKTIKKNINSNKETIFASQKEVQIYFRILKTKGIQRESNKYIVNTGIQFHKPKKRKIDSLYQQMILQSKRRNNNI